VRGPDRALPTTIGLYAQRNEAMQDQAAVQPDNLLMPRAEAVGRQQRGYATGFGAKTRGHPGSVDRQIAVGGVRLEAVGLVMVALGTLLQTIGN